MPMNPRENCHLPCSRFIHSEASLRISEQRCHSERISLQKHPINHGSRAVKYPGLCVVHRQILESDSWSPLDPNTVLKAPGGCESKLRKREPSSVK